MKYFLWLETKVVLGSTGHQLVQKEISGRFWNLWEVYFQIGFMKFLLWRRLLWLIWISKKVVMKIRGKNLTSCFNFCKCFSNRNVSCDVCIRGKNNVDTNFESSGIVDNLLFSLAAAPLNLWGSIQAEASLKQVHRSKLTTGCFRLNRASQVQRSCSNRKKQIIYITRAFKISIRISLFLNYGPHKSHFSMNTTFFSNQR